MQHHGIVNIRIEGDQNEGRKRIRAAQQVLIKLQEMLRAGGVESGGLSATLDDHAYCYARVAGDINVINIVVDAPPPILPPAGGALFERAIAPDFLSGLIYRGFIREREETLPDGTINRYDELEDFRPTLETAQKFELALDRQMSRRLAVRPHTDLSEVLSNPGTSVNIWSQYTILRPTHFSGAMQKLVQFLMGYGRRGITSIYGTLPAEVVDPGAPAIPSTTFQREASEKGLQVAFDWRWFRTHGLTKAADGRWWIVEIRQSRGIHAMPLQLHPETTTAEFRDAREAAGDTEALEVIDFFGGFPTGEGFPRDTVEFEAMVRAGFILREDDVSGLEQFYQHTPYSSVMGWAFSASGVRAHNTAYRYAEDGYQRGIHSGIDISIGNFNEWVPHSAAGQLKAKVLRAKDSTLVTDFNFKIRSVLYKIDRLSGDAVLTFLGETDATAFNAIDRRIMTPPATFSARCGIVGEGGLYWPTRDGPQLKFHEPQIGGLLSHVMTPALANSGQPPWCDTAVHVFFTGEVLRVVKYYLGDKTSRLDITNDTPECPFATTWTVSSRASANGEMSGCYSDSFDDREVVFESTSDTAFRSQPTGEYRITIADRVPVIWESDMWRDHFFLLTASNMSVAGGRKFNAVAVPDGMREAYYYALISGHDTRSESVTYSIQGLRDRYGYAGWRNFPGFNAPVIGGVAILQPHPAGCGKVTDRHVWVETPSSSECVVDRGPWASICQQMEPMVVSMNPAAPANTSASDPFRRTQTVHLVTSTPRGTLRTFHETRSGEAALFFGDLWSVRSPDDDGFIQFIGAYANAFGNGDAVVYAQNLNAIEWALVGSPQYEDMGAGFTFIGVIHG